jgi:RND family efflux transporter MFP subunit
MTFQHPYPGHSRNIFRAGLAVVMAAGALTASSTGQPPGAAPAGLTADMIAEFGGDKHITRPSLDATMGFSLATRVTAVIVKVGQSVKAGDLMARGEDAEEAVFVKLQKLRAETDLPVQKAQKAAALAKVEYEALLDAQKKSAGSPLEVDRAKLTWEGAVIDLDTAKISQAQEVLQVERYQARVDKLQLKAPFDGQVDSISADVGQSVSETDKVIRVVNIDPLRIDVPAPTARTLEQGLKVGDPAWVLMDLPGEARVHVGKIVGLSAVADSASATRTVRVELPNPAKTVAGLTAWVRFREPTGAWKDRIAPGATAASVPVPGAVAEAAK